MAKNPVPVISSSDVPVDPAMLRNAIDEFPNVSTEDSEEVSIKGVDATDFGNERDLEIFKAEGLNRFQFPSLPLKAEGTSMQ